MSLSSTSIRDTWAMLWARLRGIGLSPYVADAPPLRAELFSADQMERHGKTLAGSHRLSSRREPDQLLARLAENEDVLSQACHLLTTAVKANNPTRAAIHSASGAAFNRSQAPVTPARSADGQFLSGPSARLPNVSPNSSA